MGLVLNLIETEIQESTENLQLNLNPIHHIHSIVIGPSHSRLSIVNLQIQKQKQIFLYTILKLYMYAIFNFISFLFKSVLETKGSGSIFKSLFYNFNFKR